MIQRLIVIRYGGQRRWSLIRRCIQLAGIGVERICRGRDRNGFRSRRMGSIVAGFRGQRGCCHLLGGMGQLVGIDHRVAIRSRAGAGGGIDLVA